MTNISDTVTATATANASSGVRRPSTTCCSTCTGEPIEARIGCETSRLSAASSAKRETWSSAARSLESRGICSVMLSMISRVRSSPRIWTAPTSGSGISPPLTITSM